MKRHAHNLSHTVTSTNNMGLCYPHDIMEVFPGDSFKIEAKNLTRFLAQVAPTMHDVFVGVDTYQVPWRQLFDKLGLSWDDFLTGGEDGTTSVLLPTITVPEDGFEPGGLADWLGYPTNYVNPETGEKVIVGAGLELNALPIVAYMHVINENYRDQNFIKKLDLTKYKEFLLGEYEFQDASGKPLGYEFLRNGLFPKAWSRDYYGRALPNTQRGPVATLPLGESAGLTPSVAPIVTGGYVVSNITTTFTLTISGSLNGSFDGVWYYDFVSGEVSSNYVKLICRSGVEDSFLQWRLDLTGNTPVLQNRFYYNSWSAWSNYTPDSTGTLDWSNGVVSYTSGTGSVADLSAVNADLANATAANMIAFRLAARMQRFGEVLQQAGARAVEFTLAMFGVRIPDGRVQRPIFHGSFRLPVIFSEVLQTSQTSDTSPQGNLAGHGITGGKNSPIHIKVLEHGYIISIMHIMPRSQFQNITPRYLLRKNRWDIPNPIFQHVGEQGLKRVEIYPNTEHPDENFGYVPRYSELSHVPSTLHGHMKDTFLHWTMARVYDTEPVLSAAWRYEKPTDRSFAVRDEDQMQICIGYEIKARRVFARNPQPGIHIV